MGSMDLTDLGREIAAADSTVALTGAGVSTASGIPDFRSEDGIWADHDPADFHYSRFKADPAGFWADRGAIQTLLANEDVVPNVAHEGLADLERWGHLDAVVTQNVDGLHAAAGSESVVTLHGNAARVVCEGCGRRTEADPVFERAAQGELPPTCSVCDGVYKPDVVLFGEQLPSGAIKRARALARRADVFLAIGSSLTVQPAASLPQRAANSGATLAVVNLDETPVSDRAALDRRADVTEAVPALVAAVRRAEG
jgi:NAD-dependent deacetylase